jgi:DNA (cytosine-5)-methyltransferase 1
VKFISLFSGIGGFDLGFERAGMQCAAQVEIDEFCQKVLTKHWPNVPKFKDVKDVGRHNLPTANVIVGGFPCQPHSLAGKRKGAADDRDLWPQYFRIVDELRPAWVVGENVPGIRTTILDSVLSDLESLQYSTVTLDIPAVAFDAPHRRHRFFIVAHANSAARRIPAIAGEQKHTPLTDRHGASQSLADAESTELEWIGAEQNGKQDRSANRSWWAVEPAVGRVAHGIPLRVDRLRALGNSVVPQVAEWIGRQIMAAQS